MPSENKQLSSIFDIPGNQAVYSKLKECVKKRAAVAFVGAGAASPLYPLWPQLIASLAETAMLHGLATREDQAYWLTAAADKPVDTVSLIRAKLGDTLYYNTLYDLFKIAVGPDGLSHTPAQAALLRANFKAHVTTNYDPGLLEARRIERPQEYGTGFTVWNQRFGVAQWINGEVFADQPNTTPILFAHGIFSDPENIVLDRAGYDSAYVSSQFVSLFEQVWTTETLVMVGFGFRDSTLQHIIDNALVRRKLRSRSRLKHIAVIGHDASIGYSPEIRRMYERGFHAQVLIYPIVLSPDGSRDHSSLLDILHSLPTGLGQHESEQRKKIDASTKSGEEVRSYSIASNFVHETTEDEQFVGRASAFDRLDSWMRDCSVKVVGVTAVGGQGKTALIGKWLKGLHPGGIRNIQGRFFWSYYNNSSTESFQKSLISFGKAVFGWSGDSNKSNLLEQCLALLREYRLVVALDGLEVVQESSESSAYGSFKDSQLFDFLYGQSQNIGMSLVVMTSRFPFPNLTPLQGESLRVFPLPSLLPAEGAELLKVLSVSGASSDREVVSTNLSGHPLAIRIFARSMPRELFGDPTRLWNQIFGKAPHANDGSLERKMARLLSFYESHLSEPLRVTLGLVAIFRTPVSESALRSLWVDLYPGNDEAVLRRSLDQLHRDHLLTADPDFSGALLYDCHPILRGHFIGVISKSTGLARQAAVSLAGLPDTGCDLAGIQLIVAAIELLVRSGDIRAADELFISRLDNGNLCRDYPAPHLGLEAARSFVYDTDKRAEIRATIGDTRMGCYYNGVALFASLAGEPLTARDAYGKSADNALQRNDLKGLVISLHDSAYVEIRLGELINASLRLERAFGYCRGKVDGLERRCLASMGYTTYLRGDVMSANELMHRAELLAYHHDLYGTRAVRFAEFLLGAGRTEEARRLTLENQRLCERHNWRADAARCSVVLAKCSLVRGRFDDALRQAESARAILAPGHMVYETARLLIIESQCHFAMGNVDLARAASERAIQLAAPRSYRLLHVDALVQRSKVNAQGEIVELEQARDDAETSLQIAEYCGYGWGECAAAETLAGIWGRLGSAHEERRYRQRSQNWRRRLGILSCRG